MWLPWFGVAAVLLIGGTERQTRTIPFEDGRALSIDVTVGAVTLEGWDRPEVEITIDRPATTPSALTRLPIAIDESPARLQILAVQADSGTDPALRADVRVRLPARALIDHINVFEGSLSITGLHGSVSADVRRGPIVADDVSGTLRLETGIGAITVTRARLLPNGLLRLRAFNGNVTLALAARPADARVMALSLNGRIRSEIPLASRDAWGPRWAEATLGSGAAILSVDVVTGDVEIRSPK